MPMRNRARWCIAILLCICVCLLPAAAHSGRTDANGGHYNRATGEYHYHHGYPAHQHTDGICPYEFDDRTGGRSGTVSDSSTIPQDLPASLDSPAPPASWEDALYDFLCIFLSILLFALGIGVVANLIYLIFHLPAVIRHLKTAARCRTLYSGPIETLCEIPPGTEIGADGLPREKGASGWGETYTVYCSHAGNAYHRAGCNSAAKIPIHVFALDGRTPCKRCCPQIPDRQWYDTYLKIKDMKQKYHIK